MSVIKWVFSALFKSINFIRLLVLNLAFLLIVAIIAIAISADPVPTIPKGAALTLNLKGQIVEQRQPVDPVSEFTNELLGQDTEQFREIALTDVTHAIRFAQADNRISALILDLEGLHGTGMNKLLEIGQAIKDFKESGKPVYAYGDFYTQSQYLLASHADKVMLNPEGAVLLEGLGVYRLYFKSAIDKLAISSHVFKVGTYKSFVEPYIRDDMSKESKESNLAWLNQLWGKYIETIAMERNLAGNAISPSVEQYLERLKAAGGSQGLYAKEQELVDELKSKQEMRHFLMAQLGENDNGDNYLSIGFQDYLAAIPDAFEASTGYKDQIATIFASGEIMAGLQSAGTIGGDSLSKQLNDARLDEQVKAVVLRIDTPGGSAFASEQIRQHILALKAANKPVVVSMSSTAASGGYWIASAANEIVASPVTLTGSIGIFGMFATFEKALKKMGISGDGVGTTPFSGVGVTRPLPSYMKEIIQLSIENGYNKFLQVVVEGRKLAPEEVAQIAEGRVWTGEDAKRLGLVDHLGGLKLSLTRAASLAELDDFEIKIVEPYQSDRDALLSEFFGQVQHKLQPEILQSPSVQAILKEVDKQAAPMLRFNDPKGLYALCPACDSVKL